MTTSTTPTTTNPEQAADLAALQAAATEQAQAQALAQPQPEPGPDLAKEIAALVGVAVATLGPLFPSLRTTYTPEVTQAAAQAVAAVCDKHGWMQGGMMGRWGEEIACLAIVGPLAYQTAQGIKADLAAREEKPKDPAKLEAPKVPNQTPGQKTVTFGAPAAEAVA